GPVALPHVRRAPESLERVAVPAVDEEAELAVVVPRLDQLGVPVAVDVGGDPGEGVRGLREAVGAEEGLKGVGVGIAHGVLGCCTEYTTAPRVSRHSVARWRHARRRGLGAAASAEAAGGVADGATEELVQVGYGAAAGAGGDRLQLALGLEEERL